MWNFIAERHMMDGFPVYDVSFLLFTWVHMKMSWLFISHILVFVNLS
jgi:hypothetical protein